MSTKKSSKTIEFLDKLGIEISQLIIKIEELNGEFSPDKLIQIRNLNSQLENLISIDKKIKTKLINMLKSDNELKLLTEFDKLLNKTTYEDDSDDEEVVKITGDRIKLLRKTIENTSSEIKNIINEETEELKQPQMKKQKTDSGKIIKRKKSKTKKSSRKNTVRKRF